MSDVGQQSRSVGTVYDDTTMPTADDICAVCRPQTIYDTLYVQRRLELKGILPLVVAHLAENCHMIRPTENYRIAV